jgi:cytoskeletal protein CcmA (bactofilin family)
MLGKSKKTASDKITSPDRSGESKGTSFLSRSSAPDAKTVIGRHITIEGSIRGDEDLQIEGSMKGNIELQKHNFKVGASGQLEGEITARNVSVSGEFKGNIHCHEKVKITREADFYGEIKAKSISVEDGAYIKGVIELDREPNRKPADTGKPQTPAAEASAEKKET